MVLGGGLALLSKLRSFISGNAKGARRRSQEGWGVSALLVNSLQYPVNWITQRPGSWTGRACQLVVLTIIRRVHHWLESP